MPQFLNGSPLHGLRPSATVEAAFWTWEKLALSLNCGPYRAFAGDPWYGGVRG